MVEPRYQELLEKDIPHVSENGVHVAVIAGESLGASVSVLSTVHLRPINVCFCMVVYEFVFYRILYRI